MNILSVRMAGTMIDNYNLIVEKIKYTVRNVFTVK